MHSFCYCQHPPPGGTLVTINEPAFTLHYLPKATVYITVHSCAFYDFGQMYNDMCPPLQYHAE